MGKFYAIKNGYDKENNIEILDTIVQEWEIAKKYTAGVKNPIFKSFKKQEDAETWLGLNEQKQEQHEENCIHAYVDGSYHEATRTYSYGVVLVKNNVIVNLDSLRCVSTTTTRQVEGELSASIKAIHTAYNNKDRNIIVYHDYLGVGAHIDGTWKAKNDLSKKYVELVNKFKKAGMNIRFKHVEAHSGNIYNEIADSLCKDRLGIEQTPAINTYLRNNTIVVATEQIKNIIISMSKANPDSIIVEGGVNATAQSEVAITKQETKPQYTLPTNETVREIVRIINNLPEQKQQEILNYLNLLAK